MAGRNFMEIEPEEQQIVDLLTKLKNRGGKYPKNLLESRRQVYLSQIASVGAGIGIGAGIKAVTKVSKAGSSVHLPAVSATSLIESVLVVAIVVQAGIVAYNYRDNIVDIFKSFSSVPTDVSIPVTGSSVPDVVTSDTPVATIETPTVTETPSVTVTVETTDTTEASSSESENGSTTSQDTTITETPQPHDDNGNHFGQTPRPPKPTQEKNVPKPTKANNTGNDKKK